MKGDGKGRAFWHDYKAKCIYFITILKADHIAPFGKISGNPMLANNTPGCAKVTLDPLGKIVRNAIYNISNIEPKIKLYQYSIMPDHAHFLLSVEEVLDEKLGFVIARLKSEINHKAGQNGVFREGYNDQILRRDRDLNAIFNYIRDNPRRLAMRMANPEYFTRILNANIAGHPSILYGNVDLLLNPFKQQVIVHRSDTDDEFRRNKEFCLYTACNGGVLVSPFISKREHEIFNNAEENGGRFIKLSATPLRKREKPTGRLFKLCEEGRLLMIYPLDAPGLDKFSKQVRVTRTQALFMNDIAEIIAKE